MTAPRRKFLLDANVFIEAHKQYYAFDICPAFWESLIREHHLGRIFTAQRIRGELDKNGDRLADWIKTTVPPSFFVDDATPEVIACFAPMMQWVDAGHFLPAAKATFARAADGWLIAAAKAGGYCVVTHETRDDACRNRVKIPNVCAAFGVDHCNTFGMLRELSISFK